MILKDDSADPPADFETVPDATFYKSRVAVYLDGPHHLHAVHFRRDRAIVELLERKRWMPLRFAYENMSKTLLRQIVDEVIRVVNERHEAWLCASGVGV